MRVSEALVAILKDVRVVTASLIPVGNQTNVRDVPSRRPWVSRETSESP